MGHAARRQEDRRRTGQFRLPHLAIRNRQPGRECRGKGHGGVSNVSLGSIKRFETTGQISLLSLTKIAVALNIADDLRNIFTEIPYNSIEEVINETR